MARSVFIFNTHDLPHRAGEMREYQLSLEMTEPIGVDLLSIKAGEKIDIDLRITSVDEEFRANYFRYRGRDDKIFLLRG